MLPGDWTGNGYRDLSAHTSATVIQADEQGVFDVRIDASGAVVGGAVEIVGGGDMASGIVEGFSSAQWSVVADLSGTGAALTATGTRTLEIGGAFDISGDDEYADFNGSHTEDLRGTFSPSQADCSFAWGSFAGLGVGDDISWVAQRTGATSSADETIDALRGVTDAANALLSEPYPDIDFLEVVTERLIVLNRLVTQSADCGGLPDGYAPGTPVAGFARDLLANALDRYLDAAVVGAYTAGDIVRITTLGLEAGAFDLPRCGGATIDGEIRATMLGKLRVALAERIGALEPGSAEYLAVVAALHQFGMADMLVVSE